MGGRISGFSGLFTIGSPLEINHIYWFAHYNLSCPSSRYRGKYALDYLKKHKNIEFDFVYPSTKTKDVLQFLYVYLKVLFFRKRNSVIVFQKIRTDRFYGKLLKFLLFARKNNTIYDIDDAEYLRVPRKIIDHYIKNCSYVIASGKVLESYCKKFNPNVFISTSPIIDHHFLKKGRNKIPIIGWVGDFGNGNPIERDYSHKTSLYSVLFPALIQLKFNIKLILIGVKEKEDIPEIQNYFRPYPHIELEIPENESLDWKNDTWLYEKIREFDIGVSPILDFEFNRAKSAFKAKQYLSCGIPALASDVGENSSFVNERNGAICNSIDDFKNAIIRLIDLSNEKYQKLSEEALKNKGTFSMEQYCEKLLEVCSVIN